MFDEIAGLPVHPLLVHVPIVLAPLAALVAVVYALVPPLRRHVGWLLVLVVLPAAAGAWGAVESGKALAGTLEASPAIGRHQQLGETFRTYTILLAVVAVGLVVLDLSRRRRRRPAPPVDGDPATDPEASAGRPRGLGGVVSALLSVGLVVTAVATVFYVVRVGDSGARMVWGS